MIRAYLLLLWCCWVVAPLFAQDTIQMQKVRGVYQVPCNINGASIDMVFDTGATSVILPQAVARKLFATKNLLEGDVLGRGKASTANGKISHTTVNIRNLTVGKVQLKDVRALIIAGNSSSVLLGQSAIEKLGRITLESSRLIVHHPNR